MQKGGQKVTAVAAADEFDLEKLLMTIKAQGVYKQSNLPEGNMLVKTGTVSFFPTL